MDVYKFFILLFFIIIVVSAICIAFGWKLGAQATKESINIIDLEEMDIPLHEKDAIKDYAYTVRKTYDTEVEEKREER